MFFFFFLLSVSPGTSLESAGRIFSSSCVPTIRPGYFRFQKKKKTATTLKEGSDKQKVNTPRHHYNRVQPQWRWKRKSLSPAKNFRHELYYHDVVVVLPRELSSQNGQKNTWQKAELCNFHLVFDIYGAVLLRLMSRNVTTANPNTYRCAETKIYSEKHLANCGCFAVRWKSRSGRGWIDDVYSGERVTLEMDPAIRFLPLHVYSIVQRSQSVSTKEMGQWWCQTDAVNQRDAQSSQLCPLLGTSSFVWQRAAEFKRAKSSPTLVTKKTSWRRRKKNPIFQEASRQQNGHRQRVLQVYVFIVSWLGFSKRFALLVKWGEKDIWKKKPLAAMTVSFLPKKITFVRSSN